MLCYGCLFWRLKRRTIDLITALKSLKESYKQHLLSKILIRKQCTKPFTVILVHQTRISIVQSQYKST